MSTQTLTRNTAPANREPDPALVTLAAELDALAERIDTHIADIHAAGVVRRTHKLVAQIRAAARLVERGAHLEQCPNIAALTLAATRGRASAQHQDVFSSDIAAVDYDISRWRRHIVELHRWRGHTASLPDTDGN